MGEMARPGHRDENVDVEQETGFHSISSKSLFTSSLLTVGESGGKSTT